MKILKYIHLFLFSLIAGSAFSVEIDTSRVEGQLAGTVYCNGEIIPHANVIIKGTTIGTATNANGYFHFYDLPEGEYIVRAQAVGFKPEESSITIRSQETEKLFFELEEDMLNLEQTVVSADRNEIDRTKAPVIIHSISPKLFEATQAICIADGLDFSPGLRMECNCQNCGFSQLRMNGLEGPYSQILINSRPVFSGLAGVYGLELIPSAMVERIEVVRGGGSALFGGNAIAGTVNIITKEPSGNTFAVENKTGILGIGNDEKSKPATDQTIQLNGSVVTEDLRSGIFIYGLTRNREAYDENGDGYTEMVKMDNTTFGFNAFHKPSPRNKLSLDFYRINEFRRGGNKLDYLPHEADIAEQLNHNITGSSLSYDLFTSKTSYNKISLYSSMQKVNRDSYYGAQQDETAYGTTKDITASIGGQMTLHFNKWSFAPSTLTFGVDNNFNQLNDIKLGANKDHNTVISNQRVNTLGTFIQNDWKSGLMKISLGLRFDAYEIKDLQGEHTALNGHVFAPRANILIDLNEHLQYRISYASGYRAPQIFDEDLHIETSGARRITHRNDENLTQETSHSFTTSFNYMPHIGKVQTELLIEGFYTRLINPFANEYTPVDNQGNVEYLRVNAEDGAFVSGSNIELNAAFTKDIILSAGFTVQQSQYETARGWGDEEGNASKNFMRTPDQYGYFTFDYHPAKHLSTSLTGTYTGKMWVPHFGGSITSEADLDQLLNDNLMEEYNEAMAINRAITNGDIIEGERLERSESFLHIGINASYDFILKENTSLQVGIGMQNILNQTQENHDSGLYRDAGYIYGPCKPRTITFHIKLGNDL